MKAILLYIHRNEQREAGKLNLVPLNDVYWE